MRAVKHCAEKRLEYVIAERGGETNFSFREVCRDTTDQTALQQYRVINNIETR